MKPDPTRCDCGCGLDVGELTADLDAARADLFAAQQALITEGMAADTARAERDALLKVTEARLAAAVRLVTMVRGFEAGTVEHYYTVLEAADAYETTR